MSYYEDFGVAPNASPEQIREAYKLLVRLLHPDQQTDPALKWTAEGQLRRINRAYAILSDNERRRQYDAELYAPKQQEKPAGALVIRPPAPVARRPVLVQAAPMLWVVAAVLSLGLILWLATQGQLSQPQGMKEQATTAHAAAPPETEPTRKMELPMASSVSDPPKPEVTEPDPTPQPVPGAEPSPAPPVARTMPAIEAPAYTTPQLPAPEPPHVPTSRFGGFWALPQNKNLQHQTGQYLPVFIEATITEKDGAIHGKYKSRYFVSDRPISPNVNFEFEGKTDGGGAKLPWHGEGGSEGTLEIKLLSTDEMQLIWHATDFGQILGLASGTAVLMRRPD